MGAKRIGLIALFIVLVGAAAFIVVRPKTQGPAVLRFCTWSNYYPEAILKEFTEKTGIKLEVSYIASNEELLAKFKAGASEYDLIQPSDYMVRQMVKLDLLAPLDHSQLTNLGNLDETYRRLPYDSGNKYTVPFTWGTTGIVINTDQVKVPADGVSWKMILESPDPKHTSVLDDMREVFVVALMGLGLPYNSSNVPDLEKARAELVNVKNKILMFSAEPRALLSKGEVNIAHVYSVDGIALSAENPKFQYFIPKEGATHWTDNWAIPKTGRQADAAHQFINYFLDAQNSARIATESKLATPNKAARALLPPELTGNPAMFPPPEVMARLHFLDDLGESLNHMNRLWTELKAL